MGSFLASHPHVSIDLEERLSDEIVGLIAEGVADLGIVAGTVDASALETYPFRKDRFVLVVPRDHPLAKRSKIPFAQVLDHDFVGLDRASALQRFLADKAARIGQPLRLRVQLRSFDAVCRMVECKVGIGIVPETTARRVERTMAIATVGLADAWAVRELTDLHPAARRAAALCAATGGASARGRLTPLRPAPSVPATSHRNCGTMASTQPPRPRWRPGRGGIHDTRRNLPPP